LKEHVKKKERRCNSNIMCGRYILFTGEEYEEIQAIIREIENNNEEHISSMKTGEIFPTDIAPVIARDTNNNISFDLLKWGFPNYKQSGEVIINARGETISEKPTFKKLLYTKRCLIPASGFFEWKKNDKKKDKYLIRPEAYNFFYMAGLYNFFVDKSGKLYKGFVIITAEASKDMQSIHNRMPVIMTSKEEAYKWIDNSNTLAQIKTCIEPYKNKLFFDNLSEKSQQLKFEIQ
jgi:putative SOS response-associated peptidase YedK